MSVKNTTYTVLIVDDTLTNVILLEAILKSAGYKTGRALNGKECLTWMETHSADLILMDVMMPQMNGFELLEILRQTRSKQELPIIMLTALNESADIVKGFSLGANDYVVKPFNKVELVSRIENLLSSLQMSRIILHQKTELEQMVQNRDKLYSMISHDLRSPVASMKMLFEAMRMLKDMGEDVTEQIEQMQTMVELATEELYFLLENLLSWTRRQKNAITLQVEQIDLKSLLDKVVLSTSLIAAPKQITIVSHVDQSLWVSLDQNLTQTIIRNLLSNAIKFSAAGSIIELDAALDEDTFYITVQDHGVGIAPENMHKVLHTDESYTTYGTKQEKGTGLGLQLCKDFVQMQSGSLSFVSELGKGTTFKCVLPLINNN